MPLPSFNLSAKNVPQDKQMAMMRTYLSQLKDETETELYDIKWDNLSGGLRKRIEDLNTTINQVSDFAQLSAQNVFANYVSTDYLEANYITANAISAKYIETIKLNAAVADLGYVTAGVVDSKIVSAGYITAGEVDTKIVNAGYVKADYVDAEVAGAKRLIAGKITAGDVTADLINSRFTDANTLIATSAEFTRVKVGTHQCTFKQVPASDGGTWYALGYR